MEPMVTIKGGQRLSGTITAAGAKNAATKMMIASLLTDEPVTLTNAPDIDDVRITAELCHSLGATTVRDQQGLHLHTPAITATQVLPLSRSNRLSILALSPLLHRAGEALVPLVGGDDIGPRPVDYHLQALQQMGATIEQLDHGYRAHAADGLHGATITLPYPSVGATENIIFAAVLAKGRTHLQNAAIEPEIADVVRLLQKMGAIIEFGADRTITIDGVERLHGTQFRIIPDRLEIASYALLAIASGGEVTIKGARQDELVSFLNTLRRIGADFDIDDDGIRFYRGTQALRSIDIETDTYPGFSTDWQQPTAVLLTQAKGLSVLHETVYESRFGYVDDLNLMGAHIGVFAKCLGEIPCRFRHQSYRHSAVINGPTPLHAANLEVRDIRAGMAGVIAAAIAKGESQLTGIHHLERGYEDFWGKLTALGVDFTLNHERR